MTADSQPAAPAYRNAFRWLWIAALVLGVGFGLSAALWPQYAKPLLVAPMVMGAFAGLFLGFTVPIHGEPASETDYASSFWVRLKDRREPDIHQLDMFEQMFPDPAARRKVYRIITDQGDIRVLHVERFLELLVSRTMEDANKATDHAMALAWHRCADDLRPELRPVLTKIFREAFKADMNGNVIRLLSKMGDKIIAELQPTAEAMPGNQQPFQLVVEESVRKRKTSAKGG